VPGTDRVPGGRARFAAASAAARAEALELDVRSDNICFHHGRALLVDWNGAVRGNRVMDVAAWLPSLHAEGGPPPEAVLPEAPEAAAFMCRFFAARAGLPSIPTAPRVRAGPARAAPNRAPLGRARSGAHRTRHLRTGLTQP
jgi:aminoglycoside phosphotransferase (APT) family kinase protein